MRKDTVQLSFRYRHSCINYCQVFLSLLEMEPGPRRERTGSQIQSCRTATFRPRHRSSLPAGASGAAVLHPCDPTGSPKRPRWPAASERRGQNVSVPLADPAGGAAHQESCSRAAQHAGRRRRHVRTRWRKQEAAQRPQSRRLQEFRANEGI